MSDAVPDEWVVGWPCYARILCPDCGDHLVWKDMMGNKQCPDPNCGYVTRTGRIIFPKESKT